MRSLALAAVLAVCTGCTQVSTGLNAAADQKRQANDIQAEVWQMEACDLSLGGINRNLSADLQRAVLKHCGLSDE